VVEASCRTASLSSTLAQQIDAPLKFRSRTDVFYAYKKSEDNEGMEVLGALSGQPGLRSYPFVEIPLNTHLFHLDVPPIDDESMWQRFIFDALENVIEFLMVEKIQGFRIYVQTRRQVDADYQLKRVVEISEGYAINGKSAYIFSCANGSIEIGGFSDLKQSDIVRISSLWTERRTDT
jgi:hypothetical protein